MKHKTKLFLSFLESLHAADPVLIEAAAQGYLAINDPSAMKDLEIVKAYLQEDPLFIKLLKNVRLSYDEPGTTDREVARSTDQRRETLGQLEQYMNAVLNKQYGFEDLDAMRELWIWVTKGLNNKLEMERPKPITTKLPVKNRR